MDHPDGVDRLQRVSQPIREVGQLLGVQRAVLPHGLLQRLPVDELGDDERLGGVGLRIQHT